MSLQLFKRVKAAITAFKTPELLTCGEHVICDIVSKLPARNVEKLYLRTSEFKAGDKVQVQNILLRVVDCETVIQVEKLKG